MNENNLCIYLINLDRAKERLNFVLPFIEGLGFPVERISAVDGRNISLEDVDYDPEEYLRRFKMYPEPGTIGCALSHMRVWELFMQSQYDYALIFEDDVQFDPEILKTHVDFCVCNNKLWDMVFFELIHRGWPVEILKTDSDHALCTYLANVQHAGCYLISRKAAQRLIDNFYPIRMPVDHYMTATWQFGLRLLGIEPRLVKQVLPESYIKDHRPFKHKDIHIKAYNILYNIKRALIHFIYNLYQLIDLLLTKK